MRFVVDAQLPPPLARLLAAHGHQAVIVTKDEDFPHLLSQSLDAPIIVWLRLGNTSRNALIQWFEPLLPQIVQHIQQGDRLIEVR